MPIQELTQHQRDLMTMGLCPFCEAPIRNWTLPPFSSWVSASGPSGAMFGHRECPDCHACTTDHYFSEDARDLLSSPDWHDGVCRWKHTDPTTGHRRDCPLPQITLR